VLPYGSHAISIVLARRRLPAVPGFCFPARANQIKISVHSPTAGAASNAKIGGGQHCGLSATSSPAHLQTDRPDAQWHREPFTFKAFKLATAKILDALAPPGEMGAPSSKLSPNIFSPFDTPGSLADYAATQSLNKLFHAHSLTQEDKEMVEHYPSLRGPESEYDLLDLEILSELVGTDYTQRRIRRALGIHEPEDEQL
jgi:hypothetical protein